MVEGLLRATRKEAGGEEEEGGFGSSAVPNARVLEGCPTQPGNGEDRVLHRRTAGVRGAKCLGA